MTDDIDRRTFSQRIGMAAAAGALHGLSADAAGQGSGGAGRAAGKGDELCDLSAIELTSRIRRKQVSAREVMTAHLARIERVNPKVNAIVTLVAEARHGGCCAGRRAHGKRQHARCAPWPADRA
jgi:hypothetical protein